MENISAWAGKHLPAVPGDFYLADGGDDGGNDDGGDVLNGDAQTWLFLPLGKL